ncbi:MAG: hypothetical protein IPJ76_07420 [Flavobacteriales bacterium]|nr:MAG: hypothetical protein IPJ76_07420 [Flavobacteriales bacterium]
MPALWGIRLPTFALVRVLLAIRSILVDLFHLFWSPVISEEERDKHDMSLNERAVFMLVTVGIAVAIGVWVS